MKLLVKNIVFSILIILLMVASFFTVRHIKLNSVSFNPVKIELNENTKFPSRKNIKENNNTSTESNVTEDKSSTDNTKDTEDTTKKAVPSMRRNNLKRSNKSNGIVRGAMKTGNPSNNSDLFYILYGFETMCIGILGTVLVTQNIAHFKKD